MRNRTLRLLLMLVLVTTLHQGRTQSVETETEENSSYIPTPQTWAFIKYGNSPVDYYTGTAQVNVPLYDYSDNDFSLSISAGYASTGFMPQRQTGILGLNWFLNCGGSITREIKGIPDDLSKGNNFHGFLLSSNRYEDDLVLQQPNSSADYGNGYQIGLSETESDIYHFNFMGHSGSFVYNGQREVCVFNTNGQHGTYKIEYNIKDSGIKSFTITTGDGYRYFFGDDNGLNGIEVQVAGNFTTYGNYTIQDSNYQPIVTWFLKKITAPNGNIMEFEYDSDNSITLSDINSSTSYPYYVTSFTLANNYIQNGVNPGFGGNPGEIDSRTNLFRSVSIIKTSYLKRVTIKNGTSNTNNLVIDFTYSLKKCRDTDIKAVSPADRNAAALANIVQYLKQLDAISIHNGQLKELHNCRFSYRIKDERLILTAINISGLGSYSMSYYEEYPYPKIWTSDVDFWGYYNGKNNSDENITSTTIGENHYDEVIMNPSHNSDWKYSIIGCLQHIYYPTKGFTTFEYEPNTAKAIVLKRKDVRWADDEPRDDFVGDLDASSTSNIKYLATLNSYSSLFKNTDETGGVRIKRIIDYDGQGGYTTREFDYEYGIVSYFPRFFAYSIMRTDGKPIDCLNPYMDIPANSFDKSHIGYRKVTERYGDGSFVEYDFINYKTCPDDYLGQQRKKITIFDLPTDTLFMNNIQRAPNSRHNQRGKINRITYYNSSHQAVKREYMEYADVDREYTTYVKNSGQYAYLTKNYIGDIRPTRKISTDYWGVDSLSTQVDYIYNILGQDSLTRTILPDETIISNYTRYLHEYPEIYPTSSEYKVLNLPYLQYKTTSKSPGTQYITDAKRISYTKIGDPDQNLIRPSIVETLHTSVQILFPIFTDYYNPTYFRNNVAYNAYDSKGNPTEVKDATGVVTSYLWGYGGLYPIVMATGISYSALKQILGLESDMPLTGGISDQQRMAIGNAQNGLWNVYYYEPGVGMIHHIDPTGHETFYDYDSYGRLISIGDNKGLVEKYEYHIGR